MSEISALNSALLGIQKGYSGLRKNAQDIASLNIKDSGSSVDDLATSFVELKANALQVKASAAVLKAVDETIGSLIDDKA